MWCKDILTGRTALISGGSSGIGLACARQLASLGAEVVINGRDAVRLQAAVRTLTTAQPNARIRSVAGDVGTAAGVAAVVAATGAIDILINNAGFYRLEPFLETSDEAWQQYFDVNVLSAVRLSRAALPGMMERGFGRIVFLSSEAAIAVPAGMIPYATSKTALLTISRGLAKVAAGSGVTVNAIVPGPTFTEGLIAMLKDDESDAGPEFKETADAFVKAERTTSLLRRTATADEVAHLVTYISTPLSVATTGAALRVDGGAIDTVF